ncbi:MAG: c-type cytochrome, partial [Gemmatimonadaceae bacterium]
VPPCVSCHGPQLMGLAAMASPRLAGQDSAYVLAQLDAYVSGARNDAVMHPVASLLSPAARAAVAAYVSRLPVARVVPASASGDTMPGGANLRLGEILATRGRWATGLPACDQCHGPGGVGVGAAVPPLAGQPWIYLSNQLHAYQQGTRPPGPLSLMSAIAGRLTDADIAAVAAYYPTRSPAPGLAGGSRP